ncbi:hypothetical protein F5887DRAFT_245557 [Amanita rubescens]|nr:hypothetical protein F5887DRAFT_245557 [Amanita rubescens]
MCNHVRPHRISLGVDDLLRTLLPRVRQDCSAIPQICFSPHLPLSDTHVPQHKLHSASFNVLSRPCITRARSVLYLLHDLILDSCVSQRGDPYAPNPCCPADIAMMKRAQGSMDMNTDGFKYDLTIRSEKRDPKYGDTRKPGVTTCGTALVVIYMCFLWQRLVGSCT